MFGIGMPELIVILVVALVVLGPDKLPEIARSLGKGFSAFRKATDDIKGEIMEGAGEPEPDTAKTGPSRPEQKAPWFKDGEEKTDKGNDNPSDNPRHGKAV